MAVSSATSITSASDIQSRYLTLLVAQMKNQDPMSPMSNDQMTSQMTQLSELEQLQNISTQLGQIDTINSNFAKVLQNSQMNYAQSMVGKGITYTDSTTGNIKMGVVDQVEYLNDKLTLRVGNDSVGIDQVTAIGSQYGVSIPNNLTYAQTLLNQTVNYYDTDSKSIMSGKVTGVDTSKGQVVLQLDNNNTIDLTQVTGVQ